MAPEQVKAISEMQITREIAQTIMAENGISLGRPEQGREMPAANGQLPEGTPPAGKSPDGKKGQQPGGGTIPAELFNALIELLQTK